MAKSKKYKDKGSCKLCIVKPICNEACEDAIIYLEEMIVDFKPHGSPEPVYAFLRDIIEDILRKPNEDIEVQLYYHRDNSPIRCMLFIEDSSVYKIAEKYDG